MVLFYKKRGEIDMDYKKLRIISYNSTKVTEEEYQLRSNFLL